MPRPRKCRRICSLPQNTEFMPNCSGRDKNHMPGTSQEETIIMTLDEYEMIRLMDLEQMTQEEAAKQMNIARTTAQAIYSSARGKMAEFLVKNRRLHIEGGEIQVCEYQPKCQHKTQCSIECDKYTTCHCRNGCGEL